MDKASRLRILVLGYVVRRPLGGGTWCTLQWTLGLHRLGHDVYFLEDSEDYPCCYDPSRHLTDTDPTFGLDYASRVFARTGLGERWAYHDAHRKTWHGPCSERIEEICASADLLINVSGINTLRPWLAEVPHRAYVDVDPAFEQVRQLTDPAWRERAAGHTAFFTVGENIARGTARLPSDGNHWIATRPPVVLDCWPVSPPPPDAKFTTVMLWDSYPDRDHDGLHLGMKSESFDPYLDMPSRVAPIFELALGGSSAPRDHLRAHGWSLVNALEPTRDPWTYQQYIRDSLGEFTVAKHGYVVSHCGWFSERSANYLASGRPVITQDTGFSELLPTGAGLFAFTTPEEAVAAVRAVTADPAAHGRAARALAADCFDSDKILTRFVDLAMQTQQRNRP